MKRFLVLTVSMLLLMTFFGSSSAETYIVNTVDEPLNIRTEPQGGYDGILRQGTKVEVLSIHNGWAKIIHNGKEAYLYAEYLTPASGSQKLYDSGSVKVSAPPSVSSYTEGAMKEQVWLSSPGKLIIRKVASPTGKCIGRVPNGTILYVIDEDDVWAKVTYKNDYGYVKKEFLVEYEQCAPESSLYRVDVPDDTNLNVRTGPGGSYQIFDFINEGKKVNVLLIHDNWAEIEYSNGKIGYVQVKFLTSY